jgi:DNA (cytosine-5)-methyltransferase 1
LEDLGYAVGAADLCAAGVGAPHLRQRLYWGAVADSMHTGWASWWTEPGGGQTAGGGGAVRLADADDARLEGRRSGRDGAAERAARPGGVGGEGARATHSGWADADWLGCRDSRWRPVEPGTFPLVDGVPARVGRLRGYGNAIVPQVAAAFVTALFDAAKGEP